MSRLFVSLYLDEDVSAILAKAVRGRGFDLLTTQEAGKLGNDDSGQLAFAVDERRALLTHNRADFERLAEEYFIAERFHHGIVIAVRRPPREILARLLPLLNRFTADEMENRVLYF